MAGPGQPKTGGRVKGTPNQATAAVKDAISAAFEEVGGKDYLVQVARSDPKVFCSLLAKLVPGQIRAELECDRSGEPVKITVITGIEGSPGSNVDGRPEQRRRPELGLGEPPSEGSDSAIELAKMEHVGPDPDDKPQTVTWVPLRPDEDERQKTAQLD